MLVRFCWNLFSWGQALLRTECCGIFQNSPLSPPPSGNMGWCFTVIYCEELVNLLEVKLPKVWEPAYDLVPWDFDLSGFSTLNFQQLANENSSFPTLILICQGGFCSGKLWQSVFCLSVSLILEAVICPFPPFSIFIVRTKLAKAINDKMKNVMLYTVWGLVKTHRWPRIQTTILEEF